MMTETTEADLVLVLQQVIDGLSDPDNQYTVLANYRNGGPL